MAPDHHDPGLFLLLVKRESASVMRQIQKSVSAY